MQKEPSQLVLLMKKNETLPAYSSRNIRNIINNSIIRAGHVKGPVVGGVATSKNGNIVLTTIPPYNADLLKSYQPQWQEAIKGLPIEKCEIQRPWLKLVAHGVSVEVGEDFQEECETFNPIKVKGAVRWPKKPTKSTGSMVFAVKHTHSTRTASGAKALNMIQQSVQIGLPASCALANTI